MRVALDANVTVSGIISPKGNPARILDAWEEGLFELLVSTSILEEVTKVLSYPRIRHYHRWSDGEIREFVRGLHLFASLVESGRAVDLELKDRDDLKYLECAEAGAADYVVTGDKDFLEIREYRGIQIIAPAQFVRLLHHEP